MPTCQGKAREGLYGRHAKIGISCERHRPYAVGAGPRACPPGDHRGRPYEEIQIFVCSAYRWGREAREGLLSEKQAIRVGKS